MKRLFLLIGGVAIFIIVIGMYMKGAKETTSKSISIKGKIIYVDIAKTDLELSRGLSGRLNLASDNGMLFVFAKKDTSPIFWMKNMLFPIDIIWIDDEKVVQIDKNIKPPKHLTQKAI